MKPKQSEIKEKQTGPMDLTECGSGGTNSLYVPDVTGRVFWFEKRSLLKHREAMCCLPMFHKACQSLLRHTSGLVKKQKLSQKTLRGLLRHGEVSYDFPVPQNTSRHDQKTLLAASRGPQMASTH